MKIYAGYYFTMGNWFLLYILWVEYTIGIFLGGSLNGAEEE